MPISVAMCTFNGARFLGAQLDSIASQGRVPNELVVCDDGSADGSVEILEAFARRALFPTRISVNKRNLGSTRNFEQAISLCGGTIVALADQDDIWYPHKLERIENAFLKSSEIVAAFSDADLIDENSRPLSSSLWISNGFDARKQKQFANARSLDVLIRHPVLTGATMAFRREFFDLMIPIPENEIHDRWMSFLLAAIGPMEAIPEPLMQYRRHNNQQVGPGPLTFREQVHTAKSRKAAFYHDEVQRFCQLYERLELRKADFPDGDSVVQELQKKIAHVNHRANLPRTHFARVPGLLREALNGNYWRYSGGWRSVAKDLVI